MSKRIPEYLRVHREPELDHLAPQESGALEQLAQVFQATTGWKLPGLPQFPIEGSAVSHQRPELKKAQSAASTSSGEMAAESANQLADALWRICWELASAKQAVWQREAELAAGVPVVTRHDEAEHLAARLEAVLQGGAQAIGCHAAGIYLLDAATTELKLRASWNLPSSRLLSPPRALRGAIADLEALTGHAVVLEDDTLHQNWNVPESCGAALCVPISTPSTPLGTLWMFSEHARDFTDHQTNLAEIVAGRIASDLEREMLLAGTSGIQEAGLKSAYSWQQDQSPRVGPQLEGWQVAGWGQQVQGVGGDFFDWCTLADDSCAITVGDALETGLPAAIGASTVKTAVRAHARHAKSAGRVLELANRTLYSGSSGDLFAATFFGRIDPSSGRLAYSTAGQIGTLLLEPGKKPRKLAVGGVPLAVTLETKYRERRITVPEGSVLAIFTDGVRDALDHEGRSLGDGPLAEALIDNLDAPADQLARVARDLIFEQSTGVLDDDCAVLIVRRD